jgi:hypothetical protein
VLSLEGTGPAALELRLIGLDDGRVTTARSDAEGRFRTSLPSGTYALEAGTGYRIASGPRVVSLAVGADLQAAVMLAAQSTAPLTIEHEANHCLAAETRSILGARIEPRADVGEARVYFRSKRTQEYYYATLVPVDERYQACIPAALADAGPIEYYFAAESTGGGFVRTAPFLMPVVSATDQCPEDRDTLPRCPSGFPVLSYGAETGAATFGGLTGVPGTIATIVGVGAGAVGIGFLLPGQGPASPSR